MIENESKIIDFVVSEVKKIYPNVQQYIDMNRGFLTGSTISHLIYKFFNPKHTVPQNNDLDLFMSIDDDLRDKFKITKDLKEEHYFPENDHFEFFSTLYDREVNITFVQKNSKLTSSWIHLIKNFDINVVQIGIDIKENKIIKTEEYDLFLKNNKICFSKYIKNRIFKDILDIGAMPSYIGNFDSIYNIFSYLRILKKKEEFNLILDEENLIEKVFYQLIINNCLLKTNSVSIKESLKNYETSMCIGKKKIKALNRYEKEINKFFNFQINRVELTEDNLISFKLNTESKELEKIIEISNNIKDSKNIKLSLVLIRKYLRNNIEIKNKLEIDKIEDELYCFQFIKKKELFNQIIKRVNNSNLDFFEKFIASIYSGDLSEKTLLSFLKNHDKNFTDEYLYILNLVSGKNSYRPSPEQSLIDFVFSKFFKNRKNITINEENIVFIERLFSFKKYLDGRQKLRFLDPEKEFRKFIFLDSCS